MEVSPLLDETVTLDHEAECTPLCAGYVPSVNVCVAEPTGPTEIVAYVPVGTCTIVLPEDGKLYGEATPSNVAWKPLIPVELLRVNEVVATAQAQFVLAFICPFRFMS